MEISELKNKAKRKELEEKGIHEAFVISIAVKGVIAAVQTILGFMLLFTGSIVQFVLALVQNELIEDPGDFFGTHVQPLLNPSHDTLVFGGLYLLSHGIVKLFLVAGLLRNKLWAYPASLAVFALFILYQVERWFSTHSVWLLGLTVVDLVVMWLVWHEYRRKTKPVE
ncbi:DUF2127 domain-containing protein [Candidatus Kaiserbacteria bacterium]|nr:DUF2127 domain-containing protein [Candidatus Kaiserbacteria bacterium]